ncbi:hypothetical protein [Streptomyces sp. NPDC050121]|uniref:hypothetical protein n=1 Tax=Streptomyces sp. NPDC050121 TaxID=3365601 RepID=UPI00378BB5BA
MTSARHTTRHRRIRAARKPAIGALAAVGLLAGAWWATAGAATTSPNLTPTTTAVTLAAKFPYLSAGYNNTREWRDADLGVRPRHAYLRDGSQRGFTDHDDASDRSPEAVKENRFSEPVGQRTIRSYAP